MNKIDKIRLAYKLADELKMFDDIIFELNHERYFFNIHDASQEEELDILNYTANIQANGRPY